MFFDMVKSNKGNTKKVGRILTPAERNKKKLDKAADEFGGFTGKAVKAIKENKRKKQKQLKELGY